MLHQFVEVGLTKEKVREFLAKLKVDNEYSTEIDKNGLKCDNWLPENIFGDREDYSLMFPE